MIKKKEEEEKREEERKKEKQELREQLKKKHEERIKFRDDTLKAWRKVNESKPLYVEIEERYEHEIHLPELMEKKEKLQAKRNFYKPIVKKELDEHDKKYFSYKRNKDEEIRRNREKEI